jgi:hypothetical protein
MPLYPVVPSVSEALALLGTASLLTLFGTALRDVIPRHASLFVIPRHASAEGPLASLGATEKGSGRQPSTVSSRGTQVPRDPSLRSGWHKK